MANTGKLSAVRVHILESRFQPWVGIAQSDLLYSSTTSHLWLSSVICDELFRGPYHLYVNKRGNRTGLLVLPGTAFVSDISRIIERTSGIIAPFTSVRSYPPNAELTEPGGNATANGGTRLFVALPS